MSLTDKISNIKLLQKIYTKIKFSPDKKTRQLFKQFSEKYDRKYFTENKYKKVLFCPFAPHQINIVREGLFAHACKIRGAEVKMITYDLYLDAIDFRGKKVKKDLKVSYGINDKMYNLLKLETVKMSPFFDENKTYNISFNTLEPVDIQNLTYKDIFLGDLVIASTIRYLFCNEAEWYNPEFMKLVRNYAHSAVVLIDIYEKIIDTEKPDKIVFSHGIYVTWGTLFRIARKKGVSVDVYGGSYRKNTLRFYHNTPYAPFPDALWSEYKNIELTEKEEKKLEKYFFSRETQSEDSITLFDDNSKLSENLKNFISEGKNKKIPILALFANISWDAYMFSSSNTNFSSMVDWLTSVINFISKRNDVKLIIKAHPAEKYFKIPEKYYVRNMLPDILSENIIFIDNDENIKPFDLYKYIDAGLIYLSTVSIEMALKNIPVITSGDISQYSGKGFTIDPDSKEDFFNVLHKFINKEINFVPDKELAKRYMYYRFIREALFFDLINVENYYKVAKYNLKSVKELYPGKNNVVDIICNGILNDGEFINKSFN